MNVTLRLPAPLLPALTLPALLALSACSDDLESRNAALGLEEDGAPEMTIERQAGTDEAIEEDVIVEPPADGVISVTPQDAEGEPEVVDAGPEDLIDRAEGFAPEPMDNPTGFNPSPHVHNSGE